MKATWEMKKLGEICEENIKSPFKVEDATNSGEYPFFTSGEGVLTHDEYLVDGENIFLATGGYANVKYYNGKASYSADTWSLKVKNALTRFVYYQILARLKYIDEVLFRGSGLRHLQKKEFLNLEIPIPPLSVQQKIVKILDTIQEAIDIQEKIIEKTKELKKSLMAELFKYGAPSFRKGRKLMKTEIGEIPEDWEVVRIKDVGSVITGTTPSTSVKEFWDGDIPFVTPSDFKNDSVYVYQTGRKVTSAGAQKGRIIPKNSILVVCIGSTLGKIALSYEECITNQQINAIICENFKVNPFFVYYFLLKNQGLLKAYAGTTTKPIVKKSLFETFLIPLPSLLEQREIAEILQTIDQKIEIEKKKKELYEELFKTMLNKIMNQEIDVEKIEV
jgi:type I restriction enzyme, S subunit